MTPTEPVQHRCRPWIAVLVSILALGFGEGHAWRWLRGTVLFAIGVASVPATALLFVELSSLGALSAMVAATTFRLWTLVDAYVVARRAPLPSRGWRHRAKVLAAVVAGAMVAD